MRIDVSEITGEIGASTAFDERSRFDPVVVAGSEVSFPEPVRARGVASNTGSGIYVEGTASGRVELECSRCLRRFTQPFEVGFEALFVEPEVLERSRKPDSGHAPDRRKRGERRSPQPDEDDFTVDSAPETDVGVYPMEGHEVDVSDAILAEVTLSLPMKPLCRPDCKGICPVCGQNLNEGDCSCRPLNGPEAS